MDASDDSWEILQPNSIHGCIPNSVDSSASIESNYDHRSLIRLDYFALDSKLGFDKVAQSDFEGNQELGRGEDSKQELGSEVDSEGSFDGLVGGNQELGEEVGFEGINKTIDEEIKVKAGNESALGGELVCQESEEDGGVVESSHPGEIQGSGGAIEESSGTEEKENRGVVWWKVPVEIVKLFVFRVSPGWTISIAAAVVGYIILMKRLSRMRQKSRSIPIKLTVDDKKVSQFMTRATRLNEAFSVVKRVTTIRPLLPTASVTPWPMLNLR